MPPKRRKFESTFPAARIKKIMQLDDDVGRVASSVPVVISPARAVEIFLQALLTRGADYAATRNARTLTVGHLKHCIEQEKQWDFLRELTAKISDVAAQEDSEEATAPKRGRSEKRKASPPASAPSRRKRKAKGVEAERGEDGSGSSNEDSGSKPTTSETLAGRGMFSQYFNQPSSSTTSRASSVASASSLTPTQDSSKHQQPSTSSLPLPQPPSLLSLSSHPPTTANTLSAVTTGLHKAAAAEEEDEDYDA